MFTNKHVIIAMIVAPILAVLAWIGVGQIAGEKPHVAKPGASYPLVEQSNCRWPSGACDLENEEFSVRLTLQQDDEGTRFFLNATHPLEGVVLGLGQPEAGAAPGAMRAVDGQGLSWVLDTEVPGPEQRIMLVATAFGSRYFGEAGTTFLQPKE